MRFFLLLLLHFCGYSQVYLNYNTSNKIAYDSTVNRAKDQHTLYTQTKEFIISNYTNRGFITVIDEPEEKIYIFATVEAPLKKWFLIFGNTKEYDLTYTMKFYFKDGKYKYEFTDMRLANRPETTIKTNVITLNQSIQEGRVRAKDLEEYNPRYNHVRNRLFRFVDRYMKKEISEYNYEMSKSIDKSW